MLKLLGLGMVPLMMLGLLAAPSGAQADDNCADYVFVGARGTGAHPQGTEAYDADLYSRRKNGQSSWRRDTRSTYASVELQVLEDGHAYGIGTGTPYVIEGSGS